MLFSFPTTWALALSATAAVAIPVNSTVKPSDVTARMTTRPIPVNQSLWTQLRSRDIPPPPLEDPSYDDGLECWHKLQDNLWYIGIQTICYDPQKACYKQFRLTQSRIAKWCKVVAVLTICDTPEILPDPREITYCHKHETKNYIDMIINKRPDVNPENRIWMRPAYEVAAQKARVKKILEEKKKGDKKEKDKRGVAGDEHGDQRAVGMNATQSR